MTGIRHIQHLPSLYESVNNLGDRIEEVERTLGGLKESMDKIEEYLSDIAKLKESLESDSSEVKDLFVRLEEASQLADKENISENIESLKALRMSVLATPAVGSEIIHKRRALSDVETLIKKAEAKEAAHG